jgi:hypothetical protein
MTSDTSTFDAQRAKQYVRLKSDICELLDLKCRFDKKYPGKPPTKSSGKTPVSTQAVQKAVQVELPPGLASLVRSWATLPLHSRRIIVGMARKAGCDIETSPRPGWGPGVKSNHRSCEPYTRSLAGRSIESTHLRLQSAGWPIGRK